MHYAPRVCTLVLFIFSSMAVITKGKYAVLEAGALPHLISLFTDSSSEVRTNAVKVSLFLLTPLPSYHLHYNSTIHYYSHLYYHYTYIHTVDSDNAGRDSQRKTRAAVCSLPGMYASSHVCWVCHDSMTMCVQCDWTIGYPC